MRLTAWGFGVHRPPSAFQSERCQLFMVAGRGVAKGSEGGSVTALEGGVWEGSQSGLGLLLGGFFFI